MRQIRLVLGRSFNVGRIYELSPGNSRFLGLRKQWVAAPCLKDLKPFEACGFISGKDRKALRGLAEDDALVHAIPMYFCELREDRSLPPLQGFRRWTNIFDRQREPQPWFQFRMGGGRSGLSVLKWGTEKVSTFMGFITILSQEASSWIEVRNRKGVVLKLPDDAGWKDAKERMSRHVRCAQPSAAGDAP